MQRIVYFVANRSNKRIVETIKEFERFSKVSFISIPQKKAERLLSKIKNETKLPSVLIWSSGYRHYLSYYFDYREGREHTIKRNIDAHSDWIPPLVDPFAKYKKKRINFANHMAQSELRHRITPQFAIPECNKWCASDELFEHLARGLSKKLLTNDQIENFHRYFLSNFVDLREPFPKNHYIHLSIDFDSVPFFPSELGQWICSEGFSIHDIKEVILMAKETGRLVRVDFGGCMENLPFFNYEPIDNFTSPHFGVRYSLSLHNGREIYIAGGKKRKTPKKIIDRICSYVVSCYAMVLEAALFD